MKHTIIILLVLGAIGWNDSSVAASVDDIMKRPSIVDAQISPGGDYLAMRIFGDGQHFLQVVDRENMETTGGVKFNESDDVEVGHFFWANSERIVMKVYGVSEHNQERRYYGELYATNYDGSQSELIFGFRAGQMQTGSLIERKQWDRAWAEIIDPLPNEEQLILISAIEMNRSQDNKPRARKLDIYKGLDRTREKVSKFPKGKFFTDSTGEIRVVKSYRPDGTVHVETLPSLDGDWQTLDDSKFGSEFIPVAMAEGDEAIYVLDNIESDKLGLYKLALDGSSYEKIYVHENVDIQEVIRTVDGRGVFAMRVDDGLPRYLLFSKAHSEARLFKRFLATFPGHLISITSKSRDGRFWVVKASSDRDPGTYYLYDDKIERMTQLFKVKRSVEPKEMMPMKPIAFESFDGKSISGYFTPANKDDGASAPLVVLVHGGPRTRDYWGFDPEVQTLANKGFSVLQINYRGSSGFGKEFLHAGDHEWGDAIQRDIIAGTRWAIETGKAQKDRVCIMGSSFGGYSAVQSATMAPKLFQCVIANGGIYDLTMMYTEGDIEYKYLGENYLEEAIGQDEEQLKSYSPVYNVSKLEAPIFLAHGEKDERAPVEHAEALMEALEENGKDYVTFLKDSEGHGFNTNQNRIDYMESAIGFLNEHISE